MKEDTDGDGLNDDTKYDDYWLRVGTNAWQTNYDGDAESNNLRDSDADAEGLLDGDEVNGIIRYVVNKGDCGYLFYLVVPESYNKFFYIQNKALGY